MTRSRNFCQLIAPRRYRSGYSSTLIARWHRNTAVHPSLSKRPSLINRASYLRSIVLDIDGVVVSLGKHAMDLPDTERQFFTKQDNESIVSSKASDLILDRNLTTVIACEQDTRAECEGAKMSSSNV